MAYRNHFSHSSQRQFLPENWRDWERRIREVLEIIQDKPLESQDFKKPWFIIPITSELSENEANELLTVVRNYLFSKGQNVSSVRQILLSLHPDSLLPFLYVMRYVAFREAERRYFWPEFRKYLFNDILSYNDVAIGLASTTSSLWRRLYESTNGALYFPREGLRHIKWPLAHAGLLVEDKEVLRDFGYDILSEDISLFDEIILSEVDEFILNFQDWLQINDKHIVTRVGRLMVKKSADRNVIAEFSQQWLMAHQSEIESTFQCRIQQNKQSLFFIKRRLCYRNRENLIGMNFDAARIKGHLNTVLIWNDETNNFQSQYLAKTDETIPLNLFVPIVILPWSLKARIVIDKKAHKINIPNIDDGKSVVFDLDTGNQTKRWEFGIPYYVLIPGARYQSEKVSKIFDDWLVLNKPLGDWQDYVLIFGTTKDPFSGIQEKRVNDDLGDIIGLLEQSVEELGLPSFGHQYRVRTTLIGGRFTDVPGTTIPVFPVSRPPYLEIQGIWKDSINLSLSHFDDTSGQLIQHSQLEIGPSLSGQSNIIELWEHQVEPGKYRLDIFDTQVDLIVAPEASYSLEEYQNQANIDLWLINENGEINVSQNRYELTELTLVIKSWPLANLVFEIDISEGIYSKELLIQTNEKGEWIQDVIELPIEFESLPPGILTISVGWRGIFERELVFYDKNYISKNSLIFEIDQLSFGQFRFSCEGNILGAKTFRYIFGILLDEIPWQSSPYVFEVDVQKNSFVIPSISLPLNPKWLVVGGSSSAEFDATKFFGIAVFQLDEHLTSKMTKLHLDRLFSNLSRSWFPISEVIAQLPHPPLMERYLNVKDVFELLHRFRLINNAPKKWVFISVWNELGEVLSLSNFGYKVAIFRSRVLKKGLANTVIGGKLEQKYWSENISEISIFDEKNGEIIGQLRKRELHDVGRISIIPTTNLRGCSKCQLIVPLRYFNRHVAPYSSFEDCTGIGPAFMDLKPGTSHFIEIGVLVDSSIHYISIVKQLKSILSGNNEINDIFSPLIRNIRSIVPSHADLREWLEGLVVFLSEIWNIVSNDYYKFGNQYKLLRDTEKYQVAAGMILNSISDDNIT